MSRRVSVNNFASEVYKITKEYANEVEDASEQAVIKTAFQAEQDLHVAGDFKNGKKSKYRKGWTITFNQLRYGLEAVVHNRDYQLTHLLESGHAKFLWGKPTGEEVRAFPHIAAVNEEAQRMLEEEIKRRIG
jgi:hypothetical protein